LLLPVNGRAVEAEGDGNIERGIFAASVALLRCGAVEVGSFVEILDRKLCWYGMSEEEFAERARARNVDRGGSVNLFWRLSVRGKWQRVIYTLLAVNNIGLTPGWGLKELGGSVSVFEIAEGCGWAVGETGGRNLMSSFHPRPMPATERG